MLNDLKVALDDAKRQEQLVKNDVERLEQQINDLIKGTEQSLADGRASVRLTSKICVELDDYFTQITLIPIEALSLLAWLQKQEAELIEASTVIKNSKTGRTL